MKFEISESTVAAASECRKGHACLGTHAKDLCKVEHCVDGKLHFVRCRHHDACGYQRSFGSGAFCACPVRQELFNKYGL